MIMIAMPRAMPMMIRSSSNSACMSSSVIKSIMIYPTDLHCTMVLVVSFFWIHTSPSHVLATFAIAQLGRSS